MFHARVADAWELVARVAAATDGNLAVVTHGLVCRALVDQHLALPDGETRAEPLGQHGAHRGRARAAVDGAGARLHGAPRRRRAAVGRRGLSVRPAPAPSPAPA